MPIGKIEKTVVFELPWWTTLKRLGQSRVMTVTILVPIIGYLIIFNDKIVDLMQLAKNMIGISEEEYLNSLYFLYFGLTFLGIGSALYRIRCPREMRIYSSRIDYINDELFLMSEDSMRFLVQTIDDHPALKVPIIGRNLRRWLKDMTDKNSAKAYLKSMEVVNDAQREKIAKDFLKLFWFMQNQSRPWSRIMIIILYATGFFFLSIPSIRVFFSVWQIMWARV